MTTFDGGDDLGVTRDPPWSADSVVVREFATPVPLPLRITSVIRTREEIRLVPPDTIEFHHLAGPVRVHGRSDRRRTARGLLAAGSRTPESCPISGPVLRVAYRLLARPAIERIVRMHLADLGRRAERDAPDRGDDHSDAFGATRNPDGES